MADRRVTARLNMANAVQEVCNNNTTVVASVPAFAVLVTGLDTRITALRDQLKKLSMNNSGLSENKAYWKDRLSLLLSVVCGAGVAYARKTNDLVLENNFDYPISTFILMRDTELIETAQSIIDLQATVAAQLVDYGITTAFMTEVSDALANFEEANPKPIVNVYTSEADRELLLKMAFSLSDFVLQDMMKAALIFKVLNPVFYQSLDNASRISKVGVRHEEEPEMAAAKEAAMPLEMTELDEQRATELLDTNVQEMNATSEQAAGLALPEPSQNGY